MNDSLMDVLSRFELADIYYMAALAGADNPTVVSAVRRAAKARGITA